MNDVAPRTYHCPVEAVQDVIGGKWKIAILWHLHLRAERDGEACRLSELRRLIPDATEKMLIQHLRELERDDIISRQVYQQVPPKVEYRLTEYGRTLKDALKVVGDWGRVHIERTGGRLIEAGREGMGATPMQPRVSNGPES